jgi:xylulokinase
MSLLGIDIGTTGTKAIAFDESGQILSQAYREYDLIHPKPDWSELDANVLWVKVKDAIKEVNARLSHDTVSALSISSQGEAVVPVDKHGEVLHNLIVTFDNRTLAQFHWWEENFGAEYVFNTSGMTLHPMYSINKAMWFAANKPALHEKVWKYFCVEDYIIYRICGQAAISHSLASRTMAFDVINKRWSPDMMNKANLDDALFSNPCESGTIVGEIKKDLAGELGFTSNVAVVTGGHDQACGAIGAGVIHEGTAVNSTGTVDVLCPAFSRCLLNNSMLEKNFCCYPHAHPNLYISVAYNLTGGLLLKWHRDRICRDEVRQAEKLGIDPYSLIIDQASPEPADLFVLPHFVGAGTPTLDPFSKGAIVGLTISTDKPDLTRAVLDSINYEMKYNIECMQEAGIVIDDLRVIGGAAKSSRWLQMKADVFEKTISVPQVSEAASLGAAILASTATKIFSSLEDAIDQMVRIKKQYFPNSKEREKLQSRYKIYLKIYQTLKELNKSIDTLTSGD